jgi:hypothetical protein
MFSLLPSNTSRSSSRSNESFILDISNSSLELITQLLVKRRKYIHEEEFNKLETKIEEFQRLAMVFKMD